MKLVTKTKLTISRLWNSPQIEITLTNDGISLSMDIKDFKYALGQELGQLVSPQQLDSAVETIITGIKMESVKAL